MVLDVDELLEHEKVKSSNVVAYLLCDSRVSLPTGKGNEQCLPIAKLADSIIAPLVSSGGAFLILLIYDELRESRASCATAQCHERRRSATTFHRQAC